MKNENKNLKPWVKPDFKVLNLKNTLGGEHPSLVEAETYSNLS